MDKKRGKGIFLLMAVVLLAALILAVSFLAGLFSGLGDEREIAARPSAETGMSLEESGDGQEEQPTARPDHIINEKGNTLEKRVQTPQGYRRQKADAGSLTAFLRNYPLKKAGEPVLLYNGKKKGNQDAHAAVFQLPIEKEDLQQCADSVMRVFAEYFWKSGQKERISFRFVDGFQADYKKWRMGYRIQVGARETSWVPGGEESDSYQSFKKYLRMVFSYASTLSMKEESEKIKLSQINVGDIFLKAGSPGHVVMAVDICENEEGRKAFLLGQGYMPAQEFHLLKNPAHEDDPWYYADEVSYPFDTPEYTFGRGSLRRLKY